MKPLYLFTIIWLSFLFSIFSKAYQKCILFGLIFFDFKHLVFSFTHMCSMCKRLHSSGKFILHKRLLFENGALKMLFRHVWYLHFSNFNVDFVRQIFKLNPKFCCETKCCILATIDSNMVLLWILTEIWKKICLLSISKSKTYEISSFRTF